MFPSALFLVVSLLGVTTATTRAAECLLPWHYHDSHTNSCLCHSNPQTHGIVRCSEERVELLVGHCMTVDQEGVTYVGNCPNNYPVIDYENITEAVYVILPNNVSELNEYMCGGIDKQFHREGRVCGECEPGYSPAVHQTGFVCSKCEWYGVPVYLLLEFVPVTLFFLIILMFRISLTSAPMISFVIYCQLVTNVLTYNASIAKAFILHLDSAQSVIFHIAATLGGIWNLDFLRFLYFIPPVCVSEGLKSSHIILLSYVSAIYPQILIMITYVLIRIYNSKYGKCLVWLCKPTRSRTMIDIRRNFDEKNTVLDVFTTFLVLSYSKLVLVALVSMAFTEINTADNSFSIKVMSFDTTVEFLSSEHFPIAAAGLFVALTFGVGPPLFLLLHPTGLIGKCLRKAKLNRILAIVNHIAEKFQADYRDGTGNGPRLTYLAGMYMVIASASYFVFLLEQISAQLSWFGTAMWMIIVSLFILTVRPHKEHYMNVVSGLLMALPALYCILFVMYVYNIVQIPNPTLDVPVWIMCLVFSAPQATFIGFLIYKPIRRSQRCKRAWTKLQLWCAGTMPRNMSERQLENADTELPDRMERPEVYQNNMLERATSTDEQYPNIPDTGRTVYQL